MNAAYAASIATLAMRTATAVSKCVLTKPSSSTVLATASCDARFALAQKPKTEGRTPLATVQRSLLAVYALLWDEFTARSFIPDLHGFYTAKSWHASCT